MTSPASERYGLRPRLATFTATRPPGSSTRQHSAKTSRSISRYSTYDAGTWPSPMTASYSLPAKYGGDVTTSAIELSGTIERSRESPWITESFTAPASTTVVSSRVFGAGKRS